MFPISLTVKRFGCFVVVFVCGILRYEKIEELELQNILNRIIYKIAVITGSTCDIHKCGQYVIK